jgi:hypothetical protein
MLQRISIGCVVHSFNGLVILCVIFEHPSDGKRLIGRLKMLEYLPVTNHVSITHLETFKLLEGF